MVISPPTIWIWRAPILLLIWLPKPKAWWLEWTLPSGFLSCWIASSKQLCIAKILKAERTALNFIQRLSGIATKTHNLTKLIEQTGVKLLDTRKTTPLLRRLEKYAVRVGGGYNHRSGLYDMILIKENHIRAAGGIAEAISRVKLHNTTYKIEIEVTNLLELADAVKAGVDRVMLDNMDVRTIKQAVKKFKNKVELEVSGGINESNIQLYASTGVDYISCGALTHSVKAMDISLLFKE
jgi:nicotinate-nucleotide pyrophosphorylase (carboxylating)